LLYLIGELFVAAVFVGISCRLYRVSGKAQRENVM